MRAVVTTWYATFLIEDGVVVRTAAVPTEVVTIAERALQRRGGELTPEERELLTDRGSAEWRTRDRRLAAHGLVFDLSLPATIPSLPSPPDPALLRAGELAAAERSLEAAWDPSVHVEEAVRAVSDLDRVQNLVGERLASWVARDAPDLDASDHGRAVRLALAREESALGPLDPSLRAARERLANLYREVEGTHAELEKAVATAAPRRAPNLVALLGPDLAARLLASAGGLDRLARLPASTIQVLGAERAFFEHLRGRAPPPRHGLLFLHPSIQSAPRSERGKLARALAGKAAIAARRDHVGSPVDESLARAYETRRAALKARRGRPARDRGPRRSR